MQDVLFESKLANMCLKPKTIDNDYLKPEEQELLNHWAPEFSMVNPHVFTHMYDTVRISPFSLRACFLSEMSRMIHGSGALSHESCAPEET